MRVEMQAALRNLGGGGGGSLRENVMICRFVIFMQGSSSSLFKNTVKYIRH